MQFQTILNNERLIHSLKTALAVVIAFIITKWAHLPVDQWFIITILVVMCAQINVGSMLQKSLSRMVGTLTGSLTAFLTILLFGNSTIVHGIVITLGAVYFSYLATGQSRWSESGTLGAATIVVILINPTPTLELGIYRSLEIVGGIIIAALISQLVLPIHARTYLLREQVETLTKIQKLYAENFLWKNHQPSESMHTILDEQIIKSLMTQRKLAVDAAKEPFAKKHFAVKKFSNILLCEREILRAIDFMHYAFISSPHDMKIFTAENTAQVFHEKIITVFDNIKKQIETQNKTKLEIDMPPINILEKIVDTHKDSFKEDAMIYIDAFLFCVKILMIKTQELINCFN